MTAAGRGAGQVDSRDLRVDSARVGVLEKSGQRLFDVVVEVGVAAVDDDADVETAEVLNSPRLNSSARRIVMSGSTSKRSRIFVGATPNRAIR